jgi:hypothetical protein
MEIYLTRLEVFLVARRYVEFVGLFLKKSPVKNNITKQTIVWCDDDDEEKGSRGCHDVCLLYASFFCSTSLFNS